MRMRDGEQVEKEKTTTSLAKSSTSTIGFTRALNLVT